MKSIIRIIQRLIGNDVWFISVPRICLLLLWGVFILLKPAAALRFSAWMTIPAGITAALLLSGKLPGKFVWISALIPLFFLLLLAMLPQYDIPGILAIVSVAAAAGIKSWKLKTSLSRAVAFCAFIFALLLLARMFSGDWFDFYAASAIALFGTAGLESGSIKKSI